MAVAAGAKSPAAHGLTQSAVLLVEHFQIAHGKQQQVNQLVRHVQAGQGVAQGHRLQSTHQGQQGQHHTVGLEQDSQRLPCSLLTGLEGPQLQQGLTRHAEGQQDQQHQHQRFQQQETAQQRHGRQPGRERQSHGESQGHKQQPGLLQAHHHQGKAKGRDDAQPGITLGQPALPGMQ